MGDRPRISVEKALSLLLNSGSLLRTIEIADLSDALGRVLAEDISAALDQPPFDRSPVDGYAVRAQDTQSASKQSPAILRVTSEIDAGMFPTSPVGAGEAVRIMTGAPIPRGADCVVRQEDTDYGTESVKIYARHSLHQNFCFRGEDISCGERGIARGQRLQAAHIGLLAGLGCKKIPVFSRPKVGLLTTGDELVDVGTPLMPGKIYDSNHYLLAARIWEIGALPILTERCGDQPEQLAQAVEVALSCADLLITTGGVSVGKRDFMPKICEILGGSLLFQGVNLKPGTPAMAFRFRDKPVICLSGNPFAAAATFELLAKPVILQQSGDSSCCWQCATGILEETFPKPSPGRRFIRARIEGKRVFLPEGGAIRHSSGMLRSMAGCNCMIDIPAGSPPLSPGQEVKVILF